MHSNLHFQSISDNLFTVFYCATVSFDKVLKFQMGVFVQNGCHSIVRLSSKEENTLSHLRDNLVGEKCYHMSCGWISDIYISCLIDETELKSTCSPHLRVYFLPDIISSTWSIWYPTPTHVITIQSNTAIHNTNHTVGHITNISTSNIMSKYTNQPVYLTDS